MRGFTAEEALDASAACEPIYITRASAIRICDQHGHALADFEHDEGLPVADQVDAGRLLGWLGY